jgi:flagellar basal body-associated protein FliL
MAARPPRVLISNSCNNNEKENENMAKKSTKFIALLLTVLMVITLLPMSVLAERWY